MSAQMDMWEQSQEDRLFKLIGDVRKIQNQQQGLFKRLNELRQEAEIISAIVEEFSHEQIYKRHAINFH